MGRDLTNRTNGVQGESGLGRFVEEGKTEREISPEEGDLVAIELKEGYGLVSGDLYWGRYKIGKTGGTEPTFVYGFVRSISRKDLDIDFVVVGCRDVNERPNSDEKVLGVYVPRESISQYRVLTPNRRRIL